MNLGEIGILDVIWWVVEALVTFAASTFIFDTVHWMLHRWTKSRFRLLRVFASWHHVHHRFLDGKMQVHMDLAALNFWAHLVPEFLTSVAGTAVFYLFFHWIPVTAVMLLHVWVVHHSRRRSTEHSGRPRAHVHWSLKKWKSKLIYSSY